MRKIQVFLKNSQGVAGVLTAIGLFVFVGILAIVIDLGHLQAVRSQLRNAAEAAALAGTRALFTDQDYPHIIPATDPPFCAVATDTAIQTAGKNQSDGAAVLVLTTDIVRGWWDWQANTFTPKPGACSLAEINAIKVTARRAADTSGRVFLTLARLFGIADAEVVASATAAVGYVRTTPQNMPGAPIGLDERWIRYLWPTYNQNPAGDPPTGRQKLVLGPPKMEDKENSTDGINDGGWAVPSDGPSGGGYLKDIIQNGLPPLYLGEKLDTSTGTDSAVLMALQSAIASQKAAGNPGWDIVVPLITTDQFNDKGLPIQAFLPIRLLDVYKPGDNVPPPDGNGDKLNKIYPDANAMIVFQIIGGPFQLPGEPGGPPSAIWAYRPKLVQ